MTWHAGDKVYIKRTSGNEPLRGTIVDMKWNCLLIHFDGIGEEWVEAKLVYHDKDKHNG